MANAPGGEDVLALSEKKLAEALEHIERAKDCQDTSRTSAAQQEVRYACRRLDEALAICPQNHRARFLLVSCAMNADDYRRAKEEGLKIYRDFTGEEKIKEMDDSILHLSIAHASKMLGEMDDAIKFAAEATRLFEDDPQPYMVLGELYMAGDNLVEAEQQFRMALHHHDNPACKYPLTSQCVHFSLSCLGATLVSQGKYAEAEVVLVKASQQDDASTLPLRHLVDVYQSTGRSSDAVELAEHICGLDPGDDEMRRRLRDLKADTTRSAATRTAGPGQAAPHGLPSEAKGGDGTSLGQATNLQALVGPPSGSSASNGPVSGKRDDERSRGIGRPAGKAEFGPLAYPERSLKAFGDNDAREGRSSSRASSGKVGQARAKDGGVRSSGFCGLTCFDSAGSFDPFGSGMSCSVEAEPDDVASVDRGVPAGRIQHGHLRPS